MNAGESTTSTRLSAQSVTWLGLAANTALGAAKILAGAVFSNQTILADGLHSVSDMITDTAVLAGLRLADRPPDQDHHYGHRRISTLIAMLVGAVLLAAAVWIAYNAIVTLHDPKLRVVSWVPLSLAIASVPIKEFLYQITRWVGRRTHNISLLANAWHHRTDAVTSLAATAGLAGVAIGGPDWAFLDQLTAMVLSTFLIVVAVRIMAGSASELIDRAPGAATLAGIAQAAAETQGVRSYHAFRARQVGGRVAMDIHVQVDPTLTVREGHDIAIAVRQHVTEADPSVAEVIVHVEPGQEGPSE